MVSQTSTKISRPLPPSRPIPPTPPRGTIYVVERFGRFSRMLPGNGPPLLPLVDRVIAAFARRVDQATQPEGIHALLATNKRVIVNAKWSFRVTDPRKLAYRITDVDRCVDMLVHVRIRDTLSNLPPNTELDDPVVLKRLSEAIRVGVDATATRFGVSCPQFKVLSVRPVEERPQRSLNLAEVSSVPDYYSNEIESVLPELPREAEKPATQSFSSLPSLSPSKRINYPQPIAYPQPPRPANREPALASVRLPPPKPPPPTDAKEEPEPSDDDSLQEESQSMRQLPSTPSDDELTELAELERIRKMYARSQSLPQLIVSDDDAVDSVQPSSDTEEQASRGLDFSDDTRLTGAESVSTVRAGDRSLGSPTVLEGKGNEAEPHLDENSLTHELSRDTSSLTDDTPSSPVPRRTMVLYAPPPSPTTQDDRKTKSCVPPDLLTSALSKDNKGYSSGRTQISVPPPQERVMASSQELSHGSEPIPTDSEPVSALPKAASLLEKTDLKPSEHPPFSLGGASSSGERALPKPVHDSSGQRSPPPGRTSPASELASPPSERASPPPERLLPRSEHPPPRSEPKSRPSEAALLSPPGTSPPSELAAPSNERISPPTPQISPPLLPSTPQRLSSPFSEMQPVPSGYSGDEFSPPLASIFSRAAPTPLSELPDSERSSESPRSSQKVLQARSTETERSAPTAGTMSKPSTDVSFKDAMDHRAPSPLLLSSSKRVSEEGEKDGKVTQLPQLGKGRSVNQASRPIRPKVGTTASPMRSGEPVLGPPMIPIPIEGARTSQPMPAKTTASQTADSDLITKPESSSSIPPRAPTPPMMPLATPVQEAANREISSASPHEAGLNWQPSPIVAAEGLAPNPMNLSHRLSESVGSTHAAMVQSRAKHAIPRPAQPLYEDETNSRAIENGEADYANDAGSESEDTSTETRGQSSRDPRQRRQRVQTASLFPSRIVPAVASAGLVAGALHMLQAHGDTPRPEVAAAHASRSDPRMGLHSTGQHVNAGSSQEEVSQPELQAEHEMPGTSPEMAPTQEAMRTTEMQRRAPNYVVDGSPPRREEKRLRTTKEEEMLSRRERARREQLMNELDKIHGSNPGDLGSSDDGSTRMMVDGRSDEEREQFNDEAMSESSAHIRRRREKTRHRRRQSRRDDDEGYDSSSDEACTDCGHHHHSDGHRRSSSHRKGRSKSRSKRSEDPHQNPTEYDSESRSISRSRSGSIQRSTSEQSIDSRRSGKSSGRDRHHRKKSSTRDRKIEKSSSSTRSRSRDGKRSHSKTRSSSRKRDGDDRKKKGSKSKSKSSSRHGGPTAEQLGYRSKESAIKSIYRHRLPESDSGPENPIPWYCEGQSQAEDTDLGDCHSSDSSYSDRKHSKTKTATYSSYGRKDRHGRRHRAHHSRSVTFLYDNLR